MKLLVSDICKRKGITMKQLAEMLDISNVSLSQSINGNPNLSTLSRIALALEVPISDLFDSPRSDAFTCPNCGARLEVRERE